MVVVAVFRADALVPVASMTILAPRLHAFPAFITVVSSVDTPDKIVDISGVRHIDCPKSFSDLFSSFFKAWKQFFFMNLYELYEFQNLAFNH